MPDSIMARFVLFSGCEWWGVQAHLFHPIIIIEFISAFSVCELDVLHMKDYKQTQSTIQET